MPFMKGLAPIRRTLQYLEAGRLIFKDRVKIFSVNLNFKGDHHQGARDFVFWHLCQIQYKNPSVQVISYYDLTPSPFISCYFSDGQKMLIDVDEKSKDEILDHVIRVVGKPSDVLQAESKAREKKDNPANFGYMCEKHCICEIEGQIPCPSVVPLPKVMRGKYIVQNMNK
ncbi:hypothetical protein LSTR_LSTR006407 [Laodelphax striatellus]|uniref:Small ribosomal subunit protein mS25 n=1 Tax=Laodelphax striatellus TaxID=195883 RepID=A0A482WWZ3_LAOST|nr:hypothetical protein LSTR_LSTR006407 [Laodelphax striatellus]